MSISPKVSLLIAYRYRAKDDDIKLLTRCLDSLKSQTYQDFELVLLDSASPKWVQSQLATYFTPNNWTYHYLDTEGLFWQKSLVLNHALQYAKGEYCMVVDADFLFSANFLALLMPHLKETDFIRYRFYRLRKSDSVQGAAEIWQSAEVIRQRSEALILDDTGAVVATREAFMQVGGYDLFYRYWGKEDIDLQQRFRQIGLAAQDFDPSEAVVFHQWHAHISTHIPSGWEQILAEYFERKFTPPFSFDGKPPALGQLSPERPAKELFYREAVQYRHLNYPFEVHWAAFGGDFAQLAKGEAIRLEVSHDLIDSQAKSRIGAWVIKLNQILKKLGLSYRFVDLRTYEQDYLSPQKLRDWIFYFCLYHETLIEDYYFWQETDTTHFIVVKR